MPSTRHDLTPYLHAHDFTDAQAMRRERAMWQVTALTLAVMVLEIAVGHWARSLALVADGWHMGTHALAIGGGALAYRLSRWVTRQGGYGFGGWKIEVLTAYTSALALMAVSALLVWEGVQRLLAPQPVAYVEAMAVATLGLVVNLVSAWMLARAGYAHDHGHTHGPTQGAAPGGIHAHAHAHAHVHVDVLNPPIRQAPQDAAHVQAGDLAQRSSQYEAQHDAKHHAPHQAEHNAHPAPRPSAAGPASRQPQAATAPVHQDQNFRAAYVHVLADAVTSILAIAALAGGLWLGWAWLDAAAAILAAVVIARWAWGVLRSSASELVGARGDEAMASDIRQRIESDGDATITDLHVWQVGSTARAAVLTLVADHPLPTATYRQRLQGCAGLAHLTVEVRRCEGCVDEPGDQSC